MQLVDWLKAHNMTGTDLANLLGVDDSTINRLIPKDGKKQMRRPSLDLAARISAATNGEVTANDFMDGVPVGGGSDGNADGPGNPSRDAAA